MYYGLSSQIRNWRTDMGKRFGFRPPSAVFQRWRLDPGFDVAKDPRGPLVRLANRGELFDRDDHHLDPKGNGGEDRSWNLLEMRKCQHVACHKLFQRRTLEEAIELLESGAISSQNYWFLILFGRISVSEAISALREVQATREFIRSHRSSQTGAVA